MNVRKQKAKDNSHQAKGRHFVFSVLSSFAQRGSAFYFLLLPVACCLLPVALAQAQPRVAVLDFRGEVAASDHLRKLVRQSEFALVEAEQMGVALKGAGYQGSLNLSLDEARALGLSIGCDYYFIGLAKVVRRLVAEQEFYFDVMMGAFLVETRSGKLRRFSFEQAQVSKENLANKQLTELAERIWRQSADVLKSPPQETPHDPLAERYDLSSDEAVKLNIKPPQFYRRVKPEYNDTAEFAGITATIELQAVFQADGRIGAVEVIRWGGFGLDEASVATVRQLRFEPAKLNGRPVNVSAVVQYNFRKEEKRK
ncbi:MAG TPA: energy transducer TonB [Blastocatellia bacterium]|nr:energy transducer TonB [Blastocatellia bacterium]